MSNKLQKNIINNMLAKITQDEKGFTSKAVLRQMKVLGFEPDRIRKSLLELNGVRVKDLVDRNVKISNLYSALNPGQRSKSNWQAKVKLAEAVGVTPANFWWDCDAAA